MGVPATSASASAARPVRPTRAHMLAMTYADDDDYSADVSSASSKRKHAGDDQCCGEDLQPNKKAKKPSKNKKDEPGEKRKRHSRSKPPQSFQAILERAQSQTMYVLKRERYSTQEGPCEDIELAGSTGNIYNVTISLEPSCSCPQGKKQTQCKHIVYVLIRTLKVRQDLQYQLAFTPSELKEIFDTAPPLPTEKGDETEQDGLRKPVEDDCPICCVEFDLAGDKIVYCKAACGNNIHEACFQQWAAQKKASGGGVTCPFCRTPWQGDTAMLASIDRNAGKLTSEGYVNIAGQLGMSGLRDTSTYHSFWVRRQRRNGGLADEDPDTAIWY